MKTSPDSRSWDYYHSECWEANIEPSEEGFAAWLALHDEQEIDRISEYRD